MNNIFWIIRDLDDRDNEEGLPEASIKVPRVLAPATRGFLGSFDNLDVYDVVDEDETEEVVFFVRSLTVQFKDEDKRVFLISWDPKSFTEHEVKTVSMDYFLNQNGFEQNEIEAVEKLEIGEQARLGMGDVLVLRTFDKETKELK